MRKLLLVSLPMFLTLNGCMPSVTVRNGNVCSVAGKLAAGSICAKLTDDTTGDLSFTETVDFLEPKPARECVAVTGFPVCADDQSQGSSVKLPARGAAVVMSSDDFGDVLTELKTLCRGAGDKCTFETRQKLDRLVRLFQKELSE